MASTEAEIGLDRVIMRLGEAMIKIRDGRSDRIRTCDPLTPSQVRYQAAPRSDTLAKGALF
jgi:hypothetical protein